MEKRNEAHSKCEEWGRTPQPAAEAGEGIGREKERARLAGVWQVFFLQNYSPSITSLVIKAITMAPSDII